jgi:hypothetical protein
VLCANGQPRRSAPQRCQDPVCRAADYRSAQRPLPPEVMAAVNRTLAELDAAEGIEGNESAGNER